MRHPTLYHKGKKGKTYSWTVWTEGPNIITEYGTVDGEKQIAKRTAKPKNVGKKNATTAEEQAEKESLSMWQHKLDRKYSETVKKAEQPLSLPMLAKKLEDRRDRVYYPCDVQPKLDGVRCTAKWNNGTVELSSRSGKPYHIKHISKALKKVLPRRAVLDGEIYHHGSSLQTINKLVKKAREESLDLEFWAYDFIKKVTDSPTWTERKFHLEELAEKFPSPIVHVRSQEAKNEEDIYKLQSKFLEEGYEGAIVRLRNGVYRFGYRSDDLLKVKNFQDAEFRIVRYYLGEGKFSDICTFVCEQEEGKEFGVVIKGSLEERREITRNVEDHIGKWIKVKFFKRTDDNIPQFPVGLCFRLKEDI